MTHRPEDKLVNPGIQPIGLDEVIDFHESTKGTVESDYLFAENVYQYLFEYRGKMETSANRKNYFAFRRIELPQVALPDVPYSEVIAKRVSQRDFTGAALSLERLSQLLAPFRSTRETVVDEDFDIRLNLRPYASPGGLYPCELYVALLAVEDQPPTICHYNPREHALTPISKIDPKTFWAALGERGNAGLAGSGACFMISSMFERTVAKYGPLGYRFAMIESGIMAHHLTLSAAACDLGSLVWGGYFDEEANALFDADGFSETIVNCVFVGHSSNPTVPFDG